MAQPGPSHAIPPDARARLDHTQCGPMRTPDSSTASSATTADACTPAGKAGLARAIEPLGDAGVQQVRIGGDDPGVARHGGWADRACSTSGVTMTAAARVAGSWLW